jgi:predicted phosphodiesterase
VSETQVSSEGDFVLEFDRDQPLLVFGGPYSNLAATHAVREHARSLGIVPPHVICTGDVVAYCAEPEETAAAVRDWGCHVIQGNCEQQLAVGAEGCACNFEDGSACATLAKGWYPFANARVSQATRGWMAGLPDTLVFHFAGRTFRVVHGGVAQVNRWVFASQRELMTEELTMGGADVVLAGHAGLPFIVRAGEQTWFNPGVVGMPANDGTPEVWYGLIRAEADGIVLSTHRLAYDHHAAAAAMRRFGHANGYARTLVTGLWPSLDVLPPAERAVTGHRHKPKSTRIPSKALRGSETRMSA